MCLLAVKMDGLITLKLHMLSVGKAQQLLQGIQSVGDEGAQLTAVIEMCQVCIINGCYRNVPGMYN